MAVVTNSTGFAEEQCRRPDEHDPHVWQGGYVTGPVTAIETPIRWCPGIVPAPCCDMHNEHCEWPGEICCAQCTEIHHGVHADPPGYDVLLPSHHDGTVCVLER